MPNAFSESMEYDWIQMDVDGAFTIPKLDENIYMQIPDGMEQIYANVLKLNKNL